MKNLKALNKKELLSFIGYYNNYIINFYEDHEEGMEPVSVYEFFDNEYQEILNEDFFFDYENDTLHFTLKWGEEMNNEYRNI